MHDFINKEDNPRHLLDQIIYHRAKSVVSESLEEFKKNYNATENSITQRKLDLEELEKEIMLARSLLAAGRYDRVAFRQSIEPLLSRKDAIIREISSLESSAKLLRDQEHRISLVSSRSSAWLEDKSKKVHIYSLVECLFSGSIQIDKEASESKEWLILPKGMSFWSRSSLLSTARVDSPFGAACIGKEKGDVTSYSAPSGKSYSITITNVRIAHDSLLEEIIKFATNIDGGTRYFVDERYRVYLTEPEPHPLGQDPARRKNDP